ncbi:hypothetical protein B7R54_14575 [Subtercola boreus]|uniref:AB hydrolase-1 domain-containing protein n=1 Tax=Subtercola boreus TaxID=120213 RepID=A0A3E0VLE2_9MICO|nr:alpha/beta hydrolase [Subtercola boreus]RFA10298.1 hypothetical protein B7R54_14575 [Subtercola boreus]TQL56200.1 pimeloyl-ACP methyl ester carboxylesterase [Subtercola boreus]
MKRTQKNARLRWAGLFAAAIAVVAVVIPGQLSVASAAPLDSQAGVSASVSPKPTIVLVHGAWADGSSFAPVTTALQLAGYTVLVAPNPLRGVVEDTKAVSDFINQRTSGPVILVGHSYGGVVITGAGLNDPDVKALVYIDGYAPDNGESAQQLTNVLPGSLLNVANPTTVFDFVLPAPDAPQALYDSYIKTDQYKAIFAASLPSTVTKTLAAGQSPITLGALGTPFSGTPAWKTIPSWFFIGTADKVLPPAEQQVMAARAHGKVTEANSPHLAMIAKPLQVTGVIIDAALHYSR